jgi:hypothetical protein
MTAITRAWLPFVLLLSAQAEDVVLPGGTLIRLRLTETLSSNTVKPGSPVNLEVTQDVKIGDRVLVAQGTSAWGEISDIRRSQWLMHASPLNWSDGLGGAIGFEVRGVKSITGVRVSLTGGAHGVGSDPDLSWVGEGGPFAVPFILLAKGKNAVLSKGFIVTASVTEDLTLDAALTDRLNTEKEEGRLGQLAARGSRAIIHLYYWEDPPVGISGQSQSTILWRRSKLILVDQTEVARLRWKRFVTLSVPAGTHHFSRGKKAVTIDINPGEELYVRVNGNIQRVEDEQGEDEVYSLEPADDKDVHAPHCRTREVGLLACRTR